VDMPPTVTSVNRIIIVGFPSLTAILNQFFTLGTCYK
jgi:hypothetical protein